MFFRVVNEKIFFFRNVSKKLEKKIIQSDLDFTDSQGILVLKIETTQNRNFDFTDYCSRFYVVRIL